MKPRFPMVLLGLALAVFVLAGCAAGVNDQLDLPNAEGIVAGFWRGLWHGVIAPVTFVISLFRSDVRVYEVHNAGGWYDFGFLFGLSIVFGGGSGTAARRARGRR